MPYYLYNETDIRERKVFVEASRGCVFKCEFCLSSLDNGVRKFDIELFLSEIEKLWQRGAREFKFIDRTFNLQPAFSQQILDFFITKLPEQMFLHFEMVPDRFPEGLKERVQKFAPGYLQFEIGIQTFNDRTAELISRRQNLEKTATNIDFLINHTGVHLHTDLIIGLPGEDSTSFGRGFDTLIDWGVQEIQVGILKRLKGSPIIRHEDEYAMVYSPLQPYEIMQTSSISYEKMQHLKRFARYHDLFANRGNFKRTLPLLWQQSSPFNEFSNFAKWLFTTTGQTHEISLKRQSRLLYEYLLNEKNIDAANSLEHDLKKPFVLAAKSAAGRVVANKRQKKHLAG